jgi:hypothetical protein
MIPILNPRNRGIIYSAIALGIMAWAIVSTFFSFDFGFINRSWEVIVRPEAPMQLRMLGLMTIVLFISVIVLCIHRGLKMWRADEWETGHRTVYGAELKMEAAVVFGLGITVFFFIAQGFLWS